MANSIAEMFPNDEVRARKIGPGVFVPFPDDNEAVREDAVEELRSRAQPGGNEPDEDCDASLSEGLNQETLDSYKGVRQWVMCKAWEYHQNNDIPFAEAVDRAWSKVDSMA